MHDVNIEPNGDEPNPDDDEVEELDEIIFSPRKSTLQ